MIQLLEQAKQFTNRIALSDDKEELTYRELTLRSDVFAAILLGDVADLNEERIAFFVPPSCTYTIVQWGIWKAGGIAVPLCTQHPTEALLYVLRDIQCKRLITLGMSASLLNELQENLDLIIIDLANFTFSKDSKKELPQIDLDRRSMILYTSGTTNQPKGVVSTHRNIQAQISTLVMAWKWHAEDSILNVLPLHHVHGIINIMSCALWVGAKCHFLPKFDAGKVWSLFASGSINVFMAVPTIYYKLIAHWDEVSPPEQNIWSKATRSFRLMISGSAALPVSVLEKWKIITGHTLLERYGMTEIGMALSNPYDGERRPGHVGQALPEVQIRTVNETGVPIPREESGELEIKGPAVFKEYWQKPQATAAAFTSDGWFKTGDVGIYKNGYYRLLGRTSVDIIKSGGYKISALEIEEVIRRFPGIKDCAVVGIEDEEWGQIIGAALICTPSSIDVDQLITWSKDYLPAYKLPRRFIYLDDLPKNTIGKVTKKEVVKLFN